MIDRFSRLLWRRLRSRPHRRLRRVWPSLVPAAVERLEDRTLLAGNVTVELIGGDVFIAGDGDANSIALSLVQGDVRVQGLDGTTINGGTGPVVAVAGANTIAGNLFVTLGGGNDTFVAAPGVDVAGNAFFDAGAGDDSISLDGLDVQGRVEFRMGAGNDSVSLEDLSLALDLGVRNNGGNLLAGLSGVTVGGDVEIRSTGGEARVVLEGVAIGGRAVVKASGGEASVAVIDGQFADQLAVLTGQHDDFVFVDPTTVANATRVKTGTGDDAVVIDGANNFGGSTVIDGVDGVDAIDVDSASTFGGATNALGIDQFTVAGALINARLNDPNSGALTQFVSLITAATNLLAPPLTVDVSSNATLQSNDTLLTDDASFRIEGTTEAGATVTVDIDGDGQFDDAQATAAGDGTFTIDVTLAAGANVIVVRSTSNGTGGSREEDVDVHLAEGTVVRFNTSLGAYDVELFNDDAPITVANFLNYLARYANSFVHRSIDAFVIQGGGFTIDTAGPVLDVESVPTDPPIPNEFIAANSNVRGTLSTALIGGDADSATSQWFINTVDNLFLDQVPHTVFGVVIGSGMEIVDAINDVPTFNLNGVFDETAVSTVPLVNYTPFTVDLTGTVSVQANSVLVNGVGTQFQTELQASIGGAPGSAIRIGTQTFTVASIISNTTLTLNRSHPTGATNVTAQINDIPDEINFVVFSDISQIL